MKKKLLVALFGAIMLISVFGIAACGGKSGAGTFDITLRTPAWTYFAGDNVEVYDFIETEEGATYSFTVKKDGESEATPVAGRTYKTTYSGKYTLMITGKKGNLTAQKQMEFTVYDTLPYVFIPEYRKKYNLNDRYRLNALLNQWNPVVDSATESDITIVSVTYSDGESEGEKISLTENTGDPMFDGTWFKFTQEGLYKFEVVITNAGGSRTGSVVVECVEDLSSVPTLQDNEITFDEVASSINWTAVSGIEKYKIKIGGSSEFSETNSFVISEYLTGNDFQSFDVTVLSIDANDKPTGKIEKKIIIAPEGYENVIVSGGTVNKTTSVATLKTYGSEGYSPSSVSKVNNSYVAFYNDYGPGWAVDFEFKGDDIPQVALFASEISGNMTSTDGGKGVIGLSGFRSDKGEDVLMGPNTCTRFAVVGPNMMTNAYNQGSAERVGMWNPSQLGLSNLDVNTTYKMTVTSSEKDGAVFYKISLYNAAMDKLIEERVTNDVKINSGYIIAYAPLKGTGECEFKFSMPYEAKEEFEMDGVQASLGATLEEDGKTVTLRGYGRDSVMGNSNRGFENSFIALDGDDNFALVVPACEDLVERRF